MKEIRRQFRLSLLILLLILGLLVQLLIQPWMGLAGRRTFIRLWSRALLSACGLRLIERPPAGAAQQEAVQRSAVGTVSQPSADAPSCHAAHPAANAVSQPSLHPAGAVAEQLPQHPAADAASPPSAHPAYPAQGVAPTGGQTLAELAPGRMLVANHPSWLDIFAIDALAPAAFVAKAEIRRWPLIGLLVSQAGTLYIERGRRRAVPEAIEQMRARMRAGWPVAFFPEATTHAGPGMRAFHGNLLEAAIAEATEVLPIAIRYRHRDGRIGEAAHFLEDQNFAQSVWAILGEKDLQVELQILPPVPAAGTTRARLSADLRAMLEGALGWGFRGDE